MQDQAQNLRKLIEDAKKRREQDGEELFAKASASDARIIAVSSGKGGVGKTSITVNLAISLAKRGKQVTIIDADLGLANVDVLMGLIPKYTLYHLINGDKSLDEVAVEGPCGVKVVSGGSGIRELANLPQERLHSFIKTLQLLNDRADFIFIDTGAGIGDSVLSFIKAANDLIVVVSPDPASITDAYALLKNVKDKREEISIIVNSAGTKVEADEVFERLQIVCKRFLQIELNYMGHVLEDSHVKKASRAQRPFYLEYPNSPASSCVNLITHKLEKSEDEEAKEVKDKRFRNFISKLLHK